MPGRQLPTLFRVEPNLGAVASGRGEESFGVEGAVGCAGESSLLSHGEVALLNHH